MDISFDLTAEVLTDFFKATRKDVRATLLRYSIFMQSDYKLIADFYQGKSKSVYSSSFKNFFKIKNEVKDILSIFDKSATNLENIKYVDLVEVIEQINDTLLSLNNINKWSRCSTDLFGYNQNFKLDYVFSQNDSLEKVAKNILNSKNPQDDWYNIAIENNISENEYTSEGGVSLQLSLNNNSIQNFEINSVVDVIQGKSIYGKDLDQNIHYDTDLQDLHVLSEDETLNQAVLILVTMRKNDNVDFLNHGLQGSLVIGQNRSLLNFPVLNRQLVETFKNDDTLKNFNLTKMYFVEDNLYIDFEISSRLDEVQQLTTLL